MILNIDLIDESSGDRCLRWELEDRIVRNHRLQTSDKLVSYLDRHLRLWAQPDELRQAAANALRGPAHHTTLKVTLLPHSTPGPAPSSEAALREAQNRVRLLERTNQNLTNQQADRQRKLREKEEQNAKLLGELAAARREREAERQAYEASLAAADGQRASLEAKLAAHGAQMQKEVAGKLRLEKQVETLEEELERLRRDGGGELQTSPRNWS